MKSRKAFFQCLKWRAFLQRHTCFLAVPDMLSFNAQQDNFYYSDMFSYSADETFFSAWHSYNGWHDLFQCITRFLWVPNMISFIIHTCFLPVPYRLSSVLDMLSYNGWHDFFQCITSFLSVPYMISFIVRHSFLRYLTCFLQCLTLILLNGWHDFFQCIQAFFQCFTLYVSLSDMHMLQRLTCFRQCSTCFLTMADMILSVHNKVSFSVLSYSIIFHSQTCILTAPCILSRIWHAFLHRLTFFLN